MQSKHKNGSTTNQAKRSSITSMFRALKLKQIMSVMMVFCLVVGLMMGVVFKTAIADENLEPEEVITEEVSIEEEEELLGGISPMMGITSTAAILPPGPNEGGSPGSNNGNNTGGNSPDSNNGHGHGNGNGNGNGNGDGNDQGGNDQGGDDQGGDNHQPPKETARIEFNPGVYGNYEAEVFTVNKGDATPTPSDCYSDSYDPDYFFIGWEPAIAETVTGDATYTAQWRLKEVTVTFFVDDEVYVTVTTGIRSSIGCLMPTEPEKEGYSFSCWLYDGGPFGSETTVNGDISVYASFNPKSITFYVALNNNDGTGTETKVPYTELYDVGTIAIGKPASAVRSDYVFGGWFNEPDCVSEYLSGIFVIPSEQEQTILTLYAKWTPIYTVTFTNGYDDAKVLKTEKVVSGSNATAPTDLVREGYTFSKWDKDFTCVSKDLTVNAVWERILFNVVFRGFNGEVLARQIVPYGDNANAPTAPTVSGYNFFDWDKGFTNVKSDLEISAIYDKQAAKLITVRFVDWDGSVISLQRIELGGSAKEPASPSRSGYTFTGWLGDFTRVRNDITITAKYEAEVVAVVEDVILKEVEMPLASLPKVPEEVPSILEPAPKDVISPQSILQLSIEEGIPIFTIGNTQVPLVAPKGMEKYVYSLSNIVTASSGVAFSGFSILRTLASKKKRIRFDFYSKAAGPAQLRIGGIVVSVLMGIGGVILFFLGNNTEGLMVAFNGLTVVNTLLLIVGIVGFAFGLKKTKVKDYDSYDEEPYVFRMK